MSAAALANRVNTSIQSHVLLLGATFDTGNLGVNALATGAIECLSKRFPGVSIYLLDYARTPSIHTLQVDGSKLSVPLINIRFSKKFYLPNNIVFLLAIGVVLRLVPSRKLRQWITARNAWIRQISTAAAIASIAGGDSFSDVYGIGRFLYVSLPQVLVLLLNRPLTLLPQTIGPFRRRLSRWIARYILRRAEAVFTREYRSLQQIDNLLSRSKPRHPERAFCYDVGFLLEPSAPSGSTPIDTWFAQRQSAPLVGLNVSGLLLMGGYTRDNMFGLRIDYRQLLYRLLEYLILEMGASVVLIPHVKPGAESDVAACERIYGDWHDKYSGRLMIVSNNLDAGEIKYIIGQCDFFIGSRMHACIGAISQCVPTVAIAYSDKFIGTLEPISAGLVVDARKLPLDEIIAATATAFTDRQLIRRQLAERVPKIKESILRVLSGAPVSSPDCDRVPLQSGGSGKDDPMECLQ